MSSVDFRMGELAGAEQFETWRTLVEPCFTPVLDRDTATADFRSSFAVTPLTDTLITRCSASAQSFERSVGHLRNYGWDHIMVQHYTKGGFSGLAADRSIRAAAGDINVFDLGKTLSTQASAFGNTTFLLPRERFRDATTLHGLVVGSSSGLGRVIAEHMEAIAQVGAELAPDEADAALDALTLMIGRARLIDASPAVQAAASASLRGVVMDYIDRHLADPDLDINAVIRACRMSRATLYRLFAGEGGVAKQILSKRLDQALRLLMLQSADRSRISEIGYRCGFVNEAHFSRAFRQRFGISPRDAREIGTAAQLSDRFYTPHAWIAAMRRYRDELNANT